MVRMTTKDSAVFTVRIERLHVEESPIGKHAIKRKTGMALAEKKMMEKIGEELAAEVNGEKPPAAVTGEKETPLEFMLRIMNDPSQPDEVRARMASAAAPFLHTRKGEGAGKKEEKNERARTAGAGRFAASAPPVLKVVNKK